MNDYNVKFLDYYMKKFSVKGKNMELFIGCSKKTVYNYRQMKYDQLPVGIINKFINFFNKYFKKTEINSFFSLYTFIEGFTDEDIDFVKVKFNNYVSENINGGQLSKTNNLEHSDDLSNSMDRMTKYYASKEKEDKIENKLIIKTEDVSGLYLELLEREINKIVKEEDYDFISYLRNYSKINTSK